MLSFKKISFEIRHLVLVLVSIVVLPLFFLGVLNYTGSTAVYIGFSIVSHVFLYFGFRRGAIFFDAFIGVFFWLGFWLKFTYRLVFVDATFNDPTGLFRGTGGEFDFVLLVSSCGLGALIVASVFREKYIFKYESKTHISQGSGLLHFYKKNRILVLFSFCIFFIIVALSNMHLGIYQRGSIPDIILPYGLSGIYKWLLLFGLASFSALVLKFELELHKKPGYLVMVISLFEGFFSNISLLSRGMVLNISALFYGFYKTLIQEKIKLKTSYIVKIMIVFIVLFGASVFTVNYMRLSNLSIIQTDNIDNEKENLLETKKSINVLFIDRWVGIEGVMAISSYDNRGWGIWKKSWQEKIQYDRPSIYDAEIALATSINPNFNKHHFISVPGALAFFFYPGSFMFLFFAMFCLGILGAIIEFSVYKLGHKNLILCALFAQVIAYRFAHFGYVPAQSYLLFGAIYLNLFMIFIFNIVLSKWYKIE